ncbi:phosphotransferase [Candidatus Entotheonella palauensis]|uniref:phosphotransferase n=1 Tax=Candidatus Entotheonella palauensis TaxID=93172 RepID=UPI000B7DAF45|nr:phosphotransferase [Candidatus Entotheonella palauensis]
MDSTVSPLPPVPAGLHDFTPVWLTAALQSSGTIGAGTRVVVCQPQPLVAFALSGEAREDGGGLSGPQIVRLHLTYEGGPGPAQIVLKFGNWSDKRQMPTWPWKIRLVQVLGHMWLEDQFRSEIQFFQKIQPYIDGMQTSKVYYAAISDAPNASGWSYILFDKHTPIVFCMLMEDLTVEHFTSIRQGESLPFERAKQAFLNIVQLHASGWNQPRLWEQLQLRPAPWMTFLRADEGKQRQQRDKCLHTNFVPTYLKLWANHPRPGHETEGDPRLRDPEVIAMLMALNASFPTWAETAAKTARLAPQTWVHGDFHGWNHLFNPEDACRVIDFQFFGKGRVTDELVYFLMMLFDLAPEAEAELLHLYHRALVAAGVKDYPYDQFLYEYYVSTLTMLMGGIVRAVKFITPAAYDNMLQDQKQADLMLMGDLARERSIARALHWYRTPHLREQFFPVAGR